MLKIEVSNLKKYYGDRLILAIDNLKMYAGDRIGIVGLNGSGKTTLMNILSQSSKADQGVVNLYGQHSYITQLHDPKGDVINPKLAGKFNIIDKNKEEIKFLSGGEKTRLKIAQGLSKNIDILFADEPTCDLDMEGISILEEMLKDFKGTLVLISHDRHLLDSLCNKIIEVENGTVKEYSGNYSNYKHQKKMELDRKRFEYNQYIKEKRKLENAISDRKHRSDTMKKTPSRMGISEARLHRRSTTAKQAKLYQATKSFETRIEKLDKKEKPKEYNKTQIDIPAIKDLHSKVIISCENLTKSFNSNTLFTDINFQIFNCDKVALIGNNGTGKTTLVRMILSLEKGIKIASKAKIAYFSQQLEILDENQTILANVLKDSIHSETFVRILLARLLFRNKDVYKKVSVLSGGERVKVAFAKIFVQNINLIILDEPTNFLDVESIEALEEVLDDYEGTLLFISHDRRFIDKIADRILILEDKQLVDFSGNYSEYIQSLNNSVYNKNEEYAEKLLLLENRLSEITSRLSMPSKNDNIEELDKEFKHTVKEINKVKKLLEI
ncbi:MAG: ABC-F type ribosomal protection protein [Firmicutes bacterium]|nr:ABC-F type ribosomal protection protein [Bacillota bacterium]